jgi:hypothetical protein
MNQNSIQQSAATHSAIGDRYLIVLAFLLIGYAVLGKTFAYVGVPPLYIGEMVFALGTIAFLSTRCVIASFATLPNLLLAILICWGLIRTLPYIGEYGLNALRDSMIFGYGGFAFIITALLLEKPERLLLVVRFLRLIAVIIVPLAPFLVLATNLAGHSVTGGEEGQEVLAQPKIGTTAVHLAAAALLVFLGFKRASAIWLILLTTAMVVAATLNRGGMLVIILTLTFAAIVTGRLREFSIALGIGAALIGTLYFFDLSIPTIRQERDISAEQLVNNVGSIVGATAHDRELSGTKEWRLHWWNEIIEYTLNGPYFWSGKGFGVNLGAVDGFINPADAGTEPLRSPHSAYLTVLARSGVPGLSLWILMLTSWSAMILMNMVRARLRRDNAWANFFLLVFCYAAGFLIDAAFDVTLEGPMAGIWFWCVFGVGTGASMIYRAELARIGLPHNRLATPLSTANA